VSGIVMPFQFGTNWSRYADATANVLSPLFAYEGLVAFFLEAAFLGVLLFGRGLVPRWAHLIAAVMVAFGTLLSSFWILSANSWMQTPAGYELVDGRFYPKDWTEVIFNPSFPYRLFHTVVGFYVTTGFVVVGIAAWLIRRGRFPAEGSKMLSTTMWLLTILVPLQIFLGDQHGLNTLKHQPIKVAAMEAHWDGSKPGDFHIFAWPDEKGERNLFELSIPRGSSIILTHKVDGLFPGLTSVPAAERPPVKTVFFAFRIMLYIGFFMIAAALFGALLWWMGRLFHTRWYLHIMAHSWWIGFVAVIAGWTVTESGRQPWLVYGMLRTADAVSPVTASSVATTLALFVVAYGIVFSMGIY